MALALTLQRFWTSRRRLVLSLFLLGAFVSASVGVWNGSHRSQDFQYSGERLLLHHLDPWADFLAGDQAHALTMTQIPNYLPMLYVLLVPYGLLSFAKARILWAVTNLLLAGISAVWAARFYGLRRAGPILTVCLLLMATATRNTIGNGQQALLVLFFWCAMVELARRTSGTARSGLAQLLGASYFKFTFGPPVLLFVWFRWGAKAAVLTLVPAAAGLLVVWLWLSGGHDPHLLIKLAFEPLAVATHGFTPDPNDPNLMNVSELALGGLPLSVVNGLELALALAVCVPLSWMAFGRRREAPLEWQMALMATMSYCLFKHHSYDAVVLLFPLCYALSRWQQREALWVAGLICYLFYGERVVEAAHLHRWWFCVPDLMVLLVVLALTYRLGAREFDSPARSQQQPA